MTTFVCENCSYVFKLKKENLMKYFNPECPSCGDGDTTELDKVTRCLAEYEITQEQK